MVRSPIQAPPLHFWRSDQSVIIASVPRAIFATGEVPQEVDRQKIADSLLLNYREAERGWFKGVSRLPVNSRAFASPSGFYRTVYYDPFDMDEVRFTRDDDYVEAANALFRDATQCALSGFSQPAISLSGGLDSQAVAASVLDLTPQDARVHSFTSVPEPGWDQRSRPRRFGDERAHVEAFAAMHPRLKPTFFDAAGFGFDHKLDAMFLMAGAPPRNAINLHWVHEGHGRAKEAGCDVLLTGARGNLTFSFSGNGAFPNWALKGKWGTLLKEVWAGRRAHKSLAHAFAGLVVRPFLPRLLATGIERVRYGPRANPFETWCPLNPEWAAEQNLFQRAREMGFDPNFSQRRSTKDVRRAMLGNAANEHGELELGMELIHGIPMRDPTSYRPLLEFCFNIPDEQYVRNGRKRWLAKRMLKGRLPDMVLNETRRGQQTADWHSRLTRQRSELRAEIDALANDAQMSEMLNLPRLRQALDNWPSETPTNPKDPRSYIHLALSRGLTTARFVRYVEGRNS